MKSGRMERKEGGFGESGRVRYEIIKKEKI